MSLFRNWCIEMLGYLILLFTVLPALELLLLIKIGTHIGAINTLLIVIATGVTGAYLARVQGFFVLQRIQSQLNRGVMPTEDMINGLMILVGGIVLLAPGLITDMMGLLLLIPFTRQWIKRLVTVKMRRMMDNGKIITINSVRRD